MGIFTDLEIPFFLRNIITNQFDLGGIADSQSMLICQANIFDGERVKTHQFGSHRVDCNLIV